MFPRLFPPFFFVCSSILFKHYCYKVPVLQIVMDRLIGVRSKSNQNMLLKLKMWRMSTPPPPTVFIHCDSAQKILEFDIQMKVWISTDMDLNEWEIQKFGKVLNVLWGHDSCHVTHAKSDLVIRPGMKIILENNEEKWHKTLKFFTAL